MPKMRLTQAAVDRVSASKSGRVEFFDTYLPGFCLRVGQSGHKAWVLFYRVAGKQRRCTIGTLLSHPTVNEARERARDILREVQRGIDPVAAKVARPAQQPDTVSGLVRHFIERYAKPKNRSWQETDRTLQRHVVTRWGTRSALSITRRDVLELLDELVDRGNPIAANRVLAAIRKMFRWAVERDLLVASPVTNINAPGKEVERERVLSDDELLRVWHAADQIGGVAGAFLQMLILTGQRRNEVSTMRWLDLNLASGVWGLPRQATKGDRSHEVPLSPLAISVLASLPRAGEYIFTTTRGERPISGFSKIKALAAQLAGFDDWRLHDLRRTAGTGMARLGIAVSTISRVLNHAEGGVTKIYNRYGYLEEKRLALEAWASKIDSLIGPAENAET